MKKKRFCFVLLLALALVIVLGAVTVAAAEDVAYIDDGTTKTYYADLQTAITAAANGTTEAERTVVLMKDGLKYTGTGYALEVPANKTVIIDLNGKTINADSDDVAIFCLFHVPGGANLTVKNGTIKGETAIGGAATTYASDCFCMESNSKLNVQCNVVGVSHIVTRPGQPQVTGITVNIGDGTDTPVYFAAASNAYSVNFYGTNNYVTVSSPLEFLECYPGTNGGNDKVWDVTTATFTATSAGTAFKLEPQESTYASGISLCYTADKTTAWEGKQYATPFEVVELTTNLKNGTYRLSKEELETYVSTGYEAVAVATPTGALSGGTWYAVKIKGEYESYVARTKINTGAVTDGTWSYYMTLQEAVNAAPANTLTEVELLKDTTENITVASDDKIAFDINGHILKGLDYTDPVGHILSKTSTARSVITVNGTLTIADSNPGATHKFTPNSRGLWVLNETSGTETLTGGCITGGAGYYKDYVDGSGNYYNYGGGIFVFGGSVTMNGGNIVGNAGGMGGGVCIDTNYTTTKSSSFTLNEGKIIGNFALTAGGVCVFDSFTMTGGEISHNTADVSEFLSTRGSEGWGAGGLNFGGGDADFTMTGGKITENTVKASSSTHGNCARGGAIYAEGNGKGLPVLKLLGGEITNNTAVSYTGEAWGGGVAGGSITVGGDIKVTGNTADGKAYNVLLGPLTVATGADKPTDDMSVGVTTGTPPTATAPVAVTGSNGTNDYSKYFTSDNTAYAVYNDKTDSANQVVKLGVHSHDWEYTLAKTTTDNDTVKATCKGTGTCDYTGSDTSLTVIATSGSYDGTAHSATLSGTTIAGYTAAEMPSVGYEKKNGSAWTALTEAPKAAGAYRANITIGKVEGKKVTAVAEYTVAPCSITINTVEFSYRVEGGKCKVTVEDLTFTGTVAGDTLTLGTDFTAAAVMYDSLGNVTTDYDACMTITVTVTPKDTAAMQNYSLSTDTKIFSKEPSPLVKPVISPMKATVKPGETATFTLTTESVKKLQSVAGEGNTLTYQWYVDRNTGAFEKLDGETGTSYTTSEVVKENNGYHYRCEVKDSYNRTVVSDAALLQVSLPIPTTGDENTPILWAALALAAGLGLAVLLRRKRA